MIDLVVFVQELLLLLFPCRLLIGGSFRQSLILISAVSSLVDHVFQVGQFIIEDGLMRNIVLGFLTNKFSSIGSLQTNEFHLCDS